MRRSIFRGLSLKTVWGRSWKQFALKLIENLKEDDVPNGAAALAYYFIFSIFPALIFLLSLLPYLQIANLQVAVMDFLRQLLPTEAANMLTGNVQEIISQKKQGLLSGGAVLTLWAASTGMAAIMQQLNITYDIRESRAWWKVRGTAILLTLGFGILIICSFTLIILGGKLQEFLNHSFGIAGILLTIFAIVRWLIIASFLQLAFSLIYHFGPDKKQDFRFATLGGIFGTLLLIAASLGFKLYTDHFGNYNKTYGSLGAAIVLMLWLNVTGLVILIGSEINGLIDHFEADQHEAHEPKAASKVAS